MILLDTHVVVWRALDPEKIPLKTRQVLDQEEKIHPLRICEISLFEIAMLMKCGRLKVGLEYREFIHLILQANSYSLTGMNPEIAGLAVDLPDDVNKDPVDRIILATAIHYKTRLVTADLNLRKAGVAPVLWGGK